MARSSFVKLGKFFLVKVIVIDFLEIVISSSLPDKLSQLFRSRLSYEQFSAFLANIKDLNAQKQTREVYCLVSEILL